MKKIKFFVATCALLLAFSLNAQDLKSEKAIQNANIKVEELPEYVIIQCQNTKLLGGIGMTIDWKNSAYKEALERLQDILEKKSNLGVRTQADLLNSMSKLGFDYVNAFAASAFTESNKLNKDATSDWGGDTYRVNLVFRKKEKFRN